MSTTQAQERAGAAAFRRMFRRIAAISDATCGDDEGTDGRDYAAMEAQLRAALAVQLANDGPGLRGFLRALTHLLALNADGAGIGPAEDWDPLAATAHAYEKAEPDAAADEKTAAPSKPAAPPSGSDDWQNLIEDIAKYSHLGDAELLADLAGDALNYAGLSSGGSERARQFLHAMGQTLASLAGATTGQAEAGTARDHDENVKQASAELHEAVQMLLEQTGGTGSRTHEYVQLCHRVRTVARRMLDLSGTVMDAVWHFPPDEVEVARRREARP